LEGNVVKKTYTELMEQIESLRQEAEKARAAEIQGVIDRIKEAIRFYNLTPEDLGFEAPARAAPRERGRSKSTRAPKYSDGSGNVWSGRGPRPRWLKEALSRGAQLEQFSTGNAAR
jgi:DNA-binding protein H-NS